MAHIMLLATTSERLPMARKKTRPEGWKIALMMLAGLAVAYVLFIIGLYIVF